MTEPHEIIRTIDGVRYRCLDLGCDDFARAARNRLIVKEGLFTTFYQRMERALQQTPQKQRLPRWIPLGSLPQVSKKDWERCSGGHSSLHEIEE